MLSSQHPEEKKDVEYEIIEEIIEKGKKSACFMVMGDWNPISGEGQYRNIVGKYGLHKRNDRDTKLIGFFVKKNGLVIRNTIFRHYKRRRYTWKSPLYGERYQINYILIQEIYRNGLKNAVALPKADNDSNHNLVLANVRIKLKKIKKTSPKKVLHVKKFKKTL